ncbi:hypothetical protein EGW08_007741 [Elysia chlorotica]|uniref:PRORP domain-containing protein n=1 Tax=Elysia chlorotica TaxID=188477 RepID=A0A3S1HR58_ELYCH|nr:hypothetical protein EGW08_007741 [Elysia chlorotica]
MFRLLRSSFSWSQMYCLLAQNSSNKQSTFGKSAKDFCTVLQNQIPRISRSRVQSKSLLRSQQFQVLSRLRFHGSSQEQLDSASLGDAKAEVRSSPLSANVSRERQEWQAGFRDFISSKDGLEWQSSDWDLVAKNMSLSGGPKWEVLCMHTLYKDKNLTLGRSLMKYLEQQAHPLSQIALTFYFGLLGETSTTPEQDDEAKVIFDRVLQISDFLDPASIEVLVSGLSCTKYYKECVKLIDMCKESSTVGLSILVNTLFGSIRFQDLDLLTSTLSMIEETIEPTQLAIYSAKIIESCLASRSEILSTVMEFYKKHSLLLPLKQTEEIIEIFQRLQPTKWRIQTSYIHHRTGRCVNCQHQMERTAITEEEFKKLQQAFLDQVIVGSNIFYKSTPEEVKNFVQFVERTGPYDVVIDGLNVINKQRSPKQPEVLDKTVKHFHDQGKKVLLLGSKVLTRYISNIKRLNPKPAIYMTATTKADDSFFLYAALQSRKDTLIVSKDKLRDHKFLMDPTLRPLFQQWLKKAQIYDWFFSRYGEFTIGRRHLYNIGPQRDECGWHLPLNDIDKDYPFGNFTVLCLRDSSTVPVQNKSIKNYHANERKRQGINYGKKGQQKKSTKPASVDLEELMKC